ncbi:hypothetical protein Q3G72_017627 [Acer saccharum]|nr:hypothetical protein Q3G72_017627 [Acer saccharum]
MSADRQPRRSDLHRTEERSAPWRSDLHRTEERSAPELVRKLHLTPINASGGFSGLFLFQCKLIHCAVLAYFQNSTIKTELLAKYSAPRPPTILINSFFRARKSSLTVSSISLLP